MTNKTRLKAGTKIIPHDPFNGKKNDPAAEILVILRQLTDDKANDILQAVINEIAIDRKNAYDSACNAKDYHAKNIDRFITLVPSAEKMYADMNQKATELRK